MIPIAIEPTLPYARCDGGWGALDTALGRLPLAAVDLDVRVSGLTSTTELRQVFVNHHAQPIEATYVFPLPDRAAVQRFRMTTGDRVIEGELDERGAARDAYQAAIAAGHQAALAEEDRAGVFTMTVGNLMPGAVVTVALTLTGPLAVDDGEVTWQFPLVVAPRYMPGAALPGDQAGLGVHADTADVPDASRISPPVLLPGQPSPVRLGVRLTIDGAGLPLSSLRANLAELEARADGVAWLLALRPGQRLDRDLVLRWRLGGAALCSSAVWQPNVSGGATVAITLVPPVGMAGAGRPRDVVIVLDRSGSMDGWKMVAARRACARIVDSLTERDRFAVIAFDDRIEVPPALGGELVAARDGLRFRAVEFLAGVGARGGTELARPLEQAARLLRPDPGRDAVLVLVTDGQVGNEDQILRHVGPALGHIRTFTLGIDQAVNAGFLRRLAIAGGGACELVESEDRLDEVMAKIHRRIATPVLTDLALHGAGLALATVAPRRLPAVFAGAPVTIYCQTTVPPRPGDAIEVTGRLPAGMPHTLRIAVDSARPGVDLEASWARAHLRDLEDRFACGETYLEAEIVAVSKRHRVLSRFTAFVAVDRSAVVNPGGHARTIVQPVERPAGWGPGQGMSAPRRAQITGAPSMAAPIPASALPPPGGPPRSPIAKSMMSESARGGGGRAPMPPPAPSPVDGKRKREAVPLSLEERASARSVDAMPMEGGTSFAGYRARLVAVSEQLAAAARDGDPEYAAQLPIARLAELIDDARSVGLTDIADLLTPHLQRLHEVFGTLAMVPALVEVAAAVAALAAGRPTPATPPPATPAPGKRRGFWK